MDACGEFEVVDVVVCDEVFSATADASVLWSVDAVAGADVASGEDDAAAVGVGVVGAFVRGAVAAIDDVIGDGVVSGEFEVDGVADVSGDGVAFDEIVVGVGIVIDGAVDADACGPGVFDVIVSSDAVMASEADCASPVSVFAAMEIAVFDGDVGGWRIPVIEDDGPVAVDEGAVVDGDVVREVAHVDDAKVLRRVLRVVVHVETDVLDADIVDGIEADHVGVRAVAKEEDRSVACAAEEDVAGDPESAWEGDVAAWELDDAAAAVEVVDAALEVVEADIVKMSSAVLYVGGEVEEAVVGEIIVTVVVVSIIGGHPIIIDMYTALPIVL